MQAMTPGCNLQALCSEFLRIQTQVDDSFDLACALTFPLPPTSDATVPGAVGTHALWAQERGDMTARECRVPISNYEGPAPTPMQVREITTQMLTWK